MLCQDATKAQKQINRNEGQTAEENKWVKRLNLKSNTLGYFTNKQWKSTAISQGQSLVFGIDIWKCTKNNRLVLGPCSSSPPTLITYQIAAGQMKRFIHSTNKDTTFLGGGAPSHKVLTVLSFTVIMFAISQLVVSHMSPGVLNRFQMFHVF